MNEAPAEKDEFRTGASLLRGKFGNTHAICNRNLILFVSRNKSLDLGYPIVDLILPCAQMYRDPI